MLVEFLYGTPDTLLATGCMYKGRNKVPYELPKHKTRSTFRTCAHQWTGVNEIRVEGKRGQEEIFLHGLSDLNPIGQPIG